MNLTPKKRTELVYIHFLQHNIRLIRNMLGHKSIEYENSMGLLTRLDRPIHTPPSMEGFMCRFGKFSNRFTGAIRRLVWNVRTYKVALPRMARDWKVHPLNTTGKKGWIYDR